VRLGTGNPNFTPQSGFLADEFHATALHKYGKGEGRKTKGGTRIESISSPFALPLSPFSLVTATLPLISDSGIIISQ
jgi:hypothetical protein